MHKALKNKNLLMKKICALITIVIFFCSISNAQLNRYIVQFKHKGTTPFTLSQPSGYLSAKAIERRTKYNIAIDSTDIPIVQRFIDSVRLAGNVTILNKSKWLNSVSIYTTDAAALTKIGNMPFVASTTAIAAKVPEEIIPVNKQLDAYEANSVFTPSGTTDVLGYYSYGASGGQIRVHKGDFLHNLGFRGEGMSLAMLDAGFYHYKSLPTFDSVRNNNQIIATWDFVANETSVDEDHPHGMNCLSTIAANMPGTFVGTAPKTSFYLYRTEDGGSEYPIEEHNLAVALERADSIGVEMSSISLGYSTFDNASLNHTYTMMNGNTTIAAIANDLAAKKGMIVCVAAGNDGNNGWHYIATPADADSALTVGAVDTLGNVGSFSSYGPSSDGQVKPNVASVGVRTFVANTSNGMPTQGNGTSFATPNLAGLVTCLWQAFPEENNMSVISELQKSADKYSAPNDRTGYGIPDMKKAFVALLKKRFSSNATTIDQCNVSGSFAIKANSYFGLSLERKLATDANFTGIKTFTPSENFTNNNITFNDNLTGLTKATYQYRLKVNISTDTTLYFDLGTVNYTQNCFPIEEGVYISPNPVTNGSVFYVYKNGAQKATIQIFDASGRMVASQNFALQSGINKLMPSINKLSSGAYLASFWIDGIKEKTIRFVK